MGNTFNHKWIIPGFIATQNRLLNKNFQVKVTQEAHGLEYLLDSIPLSIEGSKDPGACQGHS